MKRNPAGVGRRVRGAGARRYGSSARGRLRRNLARKPPRLARLLFAIRIDRAKVNRLLPSFIEINRYLPDASKNKSCITEAETAIFHLRRWLIPSLSFFVTLTGISWRDPSEVFTTFETHQL